MSRNAKIAGVAAIAGIMLAVAAVDALRPQGNMPLDAILPLLDVGEQQTLLARELERCATLTMPDSGCEQAWAANRRRFFGKDTEAPEPGEDASLPATYNSAGSDDSRANEAGRPELPGKFVPVDPTGSIAP